MLRKNILIAPLQGCLSFALFIVNSVYTMLKIPSRKVVLGAVFMAFSFISSAQIVISIGSPVDAVEGTSDITFDVFIVGGGVNTTGSPITGSIDYSGIAGNGIDFIGQTSYSIPIGANSTTIVVIVIDDALPEGTEDVIALLTGTPSSGTYGNTSSTAYIYDDDSGVLLISIGSPTDTTESPIGTPFVSFTVFIEVGGVNTTGSPITGNIAYSGTAVDGADYLGSTSYSIPVGVNSTTITVPVLDDASSEPTESVIATLVGLPSVGSYANTSSTAYILDDDSGSLSISIGFPVDGTEGVGDISFDIYLDQGMVNGTGSPITGLLSFSGTATAGIDFSNIGVFSIPDGVNSITVVLSVIDDFCVEFDEIVDATISNPSIGSIGVSTSTAYIIDDDLAQGSISIGSPTDGSEDGADVSFIVSLDSGLVNCMGTSITGAISLSGTATDGADYIGQTTFSIPDGSSYSTVAMVVIDDIIIDPAETVIATISAPSIGVVSSSNTSTAIIIDNEFASVSEINSANANVTVYPNPVNSTLTVVAEKQIQSYSLVDLNGREMATGKLNAADFEVNVEKFPKGFYIVNIQFSDESSASKKVMKL